MGGMISAFFGWSLYSFIMKDYNFMILINYLLVGISIGFISLYIKKIILNKNNWKSLVMIKSKQLNVFNEVSTSMQQTQELEKILQIISTSVTAGHGLGLIAQ